MQAKGILAWAHVFLAAAGVFSLTAWVWCEKDSDDLQAIFGVASSNFKYTMTLGWGSSHFYYSDGIKV